MFKKIVLKFGYGDIYVGHDAFAQKIIFRQSKTAFKVGTTVKEDDVEFITEPYILQLSYKDYLNFIKLLDKVLDKKIKSFIFKKYIFDFTKFNPKSVEVLKQRAKNAMHLYILGLAC